MANIYAGRPVLQFAVGVGGRGRLKKNALAALAAEPLKEVTDALQALPEDISKKYQRKALKKAAEPGLQALRRNVSALGEVTGNLLAAVTSVSREYNNNRLGIPVGVIVVGFRRPTNAKSQKMATPAFAGGTVLKGPNRAYHSHLVEYGTQRRTPGRTRRTKRRRVILGGRIRTLAQTVKEQPSNARGILSSFKTRGPFFTPGVRRYPVDFIAQGSVGPSPARRPLQKALDSSRSQMRSVLDSEMRKALVKAVKDFQRQLNSTTLSTDTLMRL
jgi:hypothetical protein